MTEEQIQKRINTLYPIRGSNKNLQIIRREAYLAGYRDAIDDMHTPEEKDFFEKVAVGLRNLWPTGEKDGKYPWRDSVTNLTKRLKFIWKERDIEDKYSVDDCLVAGRKYLSQFETDAKYMQVLKYFIFKTVKIPASDGKITYVYKSTFADILEGSKLADIQNEWLSAFETSISDEQGVLI